MPGCLICDRIQRIQDGTSPYFVAELETGHVVLGDGQLFEGYSLLLFGRRLLAALRRGDGVRILASVE